MRFDMHCHTSEGSIDSKVSVKQFADMFSSMGYEGFMIADHNSYKGCRAWDAIKHEPQYSQLTVIRGIEYDTKDAGHVLIIMPDDIYLSIFRMRGMTLRKTINLVHEFGGIIGLAHPYGAAGSSAMNFKLMDDRLIGKMDFIEVFNTCESPSSNRKAALLAEKYGLPGTSGSDSHVTDYVGMACTIIDGEIRCNNDMIRAVKAAATAPETVSAIGIERQETKKGRRKEHWIGVLGYKIYNRGIGKLICPYRKYRHYKLQKAY